jgi:hypothetical protein
MVHAAKRCRPIQRFLFPDSNPGPLTDTQPSQVSRPFLEVKKHSTLQSEPETPLSTAAKANRSTVFEPNDLLLLAAYRAVGNARVEEESGVGRAKLKVCECEGTHLYHTSKSTPESGGRVEAVSKKYSYWV